MQETLSGLFIPWWITGIETRRTDLWKRSQGDKPGPSGTGLRGPR